MKIGIIGLGLIGGTIAKSLNKKHIICAYDVNKKALSYALENKIIHKAYDDLKTFLQENEIIYLCLYPDMIIEFFRDNKNLIKNGTTFIEISGVKTSIIDEIGKLKLDNLDIIYTHPIAGREFSGVEYANETIFNGANYIIVEHKNNLKKNVVLAKDLAEQMGFKTISFLSAKEHDNIIAYTSQLTHVMSMALVNSFGNTDVDLKKFTGDSYRDLTRIANINVFLWYQLFTMNKDYLFERITAFEREISKFKTALIENDVVDMVMFMAKSEYLHEKYMEEKNI
ncbi:MAG: prephenate dehydrogenase [Candidatus Izemoplasmatales bacterium]